MGNNKYSSHWYMNTLAHPEGNLTCTIFPVIKNKLFKGNAVEMTNLSYQFKSQSK